MSRRRFWTGESGVTLIELLLCIVILGVIMVPLANVTTAGFKYYVESNTRFADSHDVQIATAYFSQDAANVGVRDYSTDPGTGTSAQSIWVAPNFPSGASCGSSAGGSRLALFEWNSISATLSGGTSSVIVDTSSVAYVVRSGELHRMYCANSATTTSDATLARDFVYPDSGNTTPISCSNTNDVASACTSSAPPARIKFTLSIKGPSDTAVWHPVLTGDRRQQ